MSVVAEGGVDVGANLGGEDAEGGVVGFEQVGRGAGDGVVEAREVVLGLDDLLCGGLGEGVRGENRRDGWDKEKEGYGKESAGSGLSDHAG